MRKRVEEILRKLSLKAYGDGYKVMIIWQPEKMNATAANKLLKILEEPPGQTIFLLVSEHPGAVAGYHPVARADDTCAASWRQRR